MTKQWKVFRCSVVLLSLALSALAMYGDENPSKGSLVVTVQKEDELSGFYYPVSNTSEFYIKFTAYVDEFDIVSKTEIVISEESTPFITLKLPNVDMRHRVIPNLKGKVIEAAKRGFAIYETKPDLPAIEELFEVYEDFVEEIFKVIPHSTDEINQVFMSFLYHGSIASSVGRLADGAESDEEICQESPTYKFGDSVFICSQELELLLLRLNDTELLGGIKSATQPGLKRNKRFLGVVLGIAAGFVLPHVLGTRGSDHGCCGNYSGRCWFSHWLCWAHDKLCTCCGGWWCFNGCKKDPGCP